MASVTVRKIPAETHRVRKLSVAKHGRSTEAEIRSILERAVRPRLGIGSALAAIGRSVGGVELVSRRDATRVDAAKFE